MLIFKLLVPAKQYGLYLGHEPNPAFLFPRRGFFLYLTPRLSLCVTVTTDFRIHEHGAGSLFGPFLLDLGYDSLRISKHNTTEIAFTGLASGLFINPYHMCSVLRLSSECLAFITILAILSPLRVPLVKETGLVFMMTKPLVKRHYHIWVFWIIVNFIIILS
jgi:hypothetical protein